MPCPPQLFSAARSFHLSRCFYRRVHEDDPLACSEGKNQFPTTDRKPFCTDVAEIGMIKESTHFLLRCEGEANKVCLAAANASKWMHKGFRCADKPAFLEAPTSPSKSSKSAREPTWSARACSWCISGARKSSRTWHCSGLCEKACFVNDKIISGGVLQNRVPLQGAVKTAPPFDSVIIPINFVDESHW